MQLSTLIQLMFMAINMIGTGLGVYVGLKIGLARLETWRDIAAVDIKDQRRDIDRLNDDSLVHDMEIATLFRNEGMERAVRQRMRG